MGGRLAKERLFLLTRIAPSSFSRLCFRENCRASTH